MTELLTLGLLAAAVCFFVGLCVIGRWIVRVVQDREKTFPELERILVMLVVLYLAGTLVHWVVSLIEHIGPKTGIDSPAEKPGLTTFDLVVFGFVALQVFLFVLLPKMRAWLRRNP
jgi:hypothetical protein